MITHRNSAKIFPPGMEPLGDDEFSFDCHPGVACFTVCCRQVDVTLYPHDVIRLKNALALDAEHFLRRYVQVVRGENPYFPNLTLRMTDQAVCPFLSDAGCQVYSHRPSACRSYPLERAVDRSGGGSQPEEYYFMVRHGYCLGHAQPKRHTVAGWLRSQRLLEDSTMHALWVEMDTLFRRNPWKGEGAGGEKQQLAFMVCYNIDGFRRFSVEHNLIRQFVLSKPQRRRIEQDDLELLNFGCQWLKGLLTGKSALAKK